MRGAIVKVVILTLGFAFTANAHGLVMPQIHLYRVAISYPVYTPKLSVASAPMILPVAPGSSLGARPIGPAYPSYGTPMGMARPMPPALVMPPQAYTYNPYAMMPPPQQNQMSPMMMMLPMMMKMLGGGGGGGGGSGIGGGGAAGPQTFGGGGGGSSSGLPAYTAEGARNNTPGDLGVDTSQINTADLSTRSCVQPHDEFQCMVCNCYFEAADEPYAGKVEVDRVVITRKKNFTDYHQSSLCGVIYQPQQFSWTNGYRGRKVMTSTPAIKQCMAASKEALSRGADGYDHYHAYYVSPRWKYGMTFERRIGSHLFYSQDSMSYADSPGGAIGSPGAVAATAP